MIRQPRNKNEKIFLRDFGEKEYDAVINYEDDLYNRKVILMNEMNKDKNIEYLRDLITNFCSILNTPNKSYEDNIKNECIYKPIISEERKLNFSYTIYEDTYKKYISNTEYLTDNYKNDFKLEGASNNLVPLTLGHVLNAVYLNCSRSLMCTNITHNFSTSDALMNGLYEPVPDYHKKEDFIYFYAQLSLCIETKTTKEFNIPIANLFFGETDKKWIISEYSQDNCYEIPNYPNRKFNVRVDNKNNVVSVERV